MFSRAVKSYEDSKPAIPPPSRGASMALGKQLFPSSSPSASHDGNIADQFKKSRAVPSSFGSATSRSQSSSGSLKSHTDALKLRSPNVKPTTNLRKQPETAFTNHGKSFASLYNKSDSFKQEPEIIDLVDDDVKPKQNGRPNPYVHFDADDFSDDDTLNLDFECPSTLPSLPTQPTQPTPITKSQEPVVGSSTSRLSWSQSSPSHFRPPQRPSITMANPPTKRASPDEDLQSPRRPPKKRQLPKHWKTKSEEPVDIAPHQATPMTKKSAEPWNSTASAIKDRKRQLKNQQKKPSLDDEAPDEAGRRPEATISKPHKPPPISLSKEQEQVKSLVCNNNASVFFTGPAGTGKSVLMRSIIEDLKKKWARDPERLAVTASTGLAACNIGGMTLHSFGGIGLGKEDVQALIKKIRRNPKAKNRWLRTKTLIIDEISMLDGELFDKLSQIGRTIRNNGRPWGGIQLVITGDFFQLPPVPDGDKKREVKFAFEAATWNTSIDHTIGLTEVFRQKDPAFAEMLNEMRLGRISEQTVQSFKAMSRPLNFGDGLEVTELFPTRFEVDASNKKRLKDLSGTSHRYDAVDSGDPAIRERLIQNMMAPQVLELKKGAQVMLIKNMDDSLVNGSLGTVEGFMTQTEFDVVGGVDDYGSETEDMDPNVKKRIKAFGRQLERSGSREGKLYPCVRFHGVDGSQRTLLCMPEEWKAELPTGEVQAQRIQLPLILAWALSIHKAQGQTLERVKVDLGKVFEKGQAYVALSRATTQQGLQVMRFEKHKVMAHPRVVQFYNKLYSAESVVTKKTQIQPSITSFAAKREPALSIFARKGTNYIDLDDEEEALAAYG